MINHVRTLLMNMDGSGASLSPGEQYVPVEYSAVPLPDYLRVCRAALFGTNPDRTMLNYRIAQYMAILHAAELKQYVLDLDPRVTYTREVGGVRRDLFEPATYVPQINGPDGLYLQGLPASPDAEGRMLFNYSLNLAAGTVTQWSPRAKSLNFVPTYTSGISQPVPLIDSGYSVQIPQDAPGDAIWTIAIYNRPQWDVGQVALKLKTIGEPNLLQLFGPSPVEPYLTFSNLFYYHPELGYALSGFLLAVAYRTHALWAGVTGG